MVVGYLTQTPLFSSSIIENTIAHCKANPLFGCTYFFFDHRDSQKELQLHGNLIRSLILQLWDHCDALPFPLVKLYGHGHQQPSINSLHETLQLMISGFEQVYIIIDALDECTEPVKLLEW